MRSWRHNQALIRRLAVPRLTEASIRLVVLLSSKLSNAKHFCGIFVPQAGLSGEHIPLQ
jgi:hypothetical protein